MKIGELLKGCISIDLETTGIDPESLPEEPKPHTALNGALHNIECVRRVLMRYA